jgi:predicted LPLAT superfamily acyltransferase
VVSVAGRYQFHQGTILVGAHFGDWSLCGIGLAASNGRPVHIVMNPHITPRFVSQLKGMLGDQLKLIDASMDGFSVAMAVKEVIEQQGLVCFMADRLGGDKSEVSLDFLGATTAFPRGPFAIARLLKCPLYSFYCLKSGLKPRSRYMLYSRELWDAKQDVTAEELAARFRDDLEERVRQTPHHWFNFYHFWPQGSEHAAEGSYLPSTPRHA